MILRNVNLSRIRDNNLRIRLERAQSWIELAKSYEKHENSEHARFIFYWIAFNAMYGLKPPNPMNQEEIPPNQMQEITKFFEKLKRVRVDGERETGLLYKHFHNMKDDLEVLIKDSFLSKKYWEGSDSPSAVKSTCVNDWAEAQKALQRSVFPEKAFSHACSRLLVLRNQIVHGSAKGNHKSRGFPSLKKGLQMIEKMVPVFFELLVHSEDHSEKWPEAPYPRWGHPEHPHQYTDGEPHELLGNRPESN